MIHDDRITRVEFSSDGKFLTTLGGERARVWEAGSCRELARLKHEDEVTTARFVDGGQVITVTKDNKAHLSVG